MRVFKLVVEVCVTGIQRYDYQYNPKKDETKPLVLVREPHNKFDKNAIIVKLGDNKIGYVKREEAQLLSPLLATNKISVKKWKCDIDKSTGRYMIVQLYMVGTE